VAGLVNRTLALVPLLLLVFVAAACNSTTGSAKKTYKGIWLQNLPERAHAELNWVESAPDEMLMRVGRLEVWQQGWTAGVSLTNISHRTILFPKGGQSSPIDFGLGVFTDVNSPRLEDPGNYLIYADKITPKMPKELKPGQRWVGTFASSTPPRASRILRLVFGVFFWKGTPPPGQGPFFLLVTQHSEKAPPPIGAAAAKKLALTTPG
jgi:hypothetical protein